jgi:hypothetical protein
MGTASFFYSMYQKWPFHCSKNNLYHKQNKEGIIQMKKNGKKVTVVGTDIDEVQRLNRQSGLSYNQVKQLLAEKYAHNSRPSE